MKFIALFLAFVTLSLAQTVFPQFSTVPTNSWSQQSFKIQNAATRGPATIISDVYFEVLVLTSDSAADKLGVFYGYNQPIGNVGAVNGKSNGTGSFYVYGDAGVYSLQILVTYKQNGQQQLSTQGPFSLTVSGPAGPQGPQGPQGPREVSREELGDVEVVFESEDFSILKRDGSNSDLSTYAGSADNFYGVPGQVTYNSYYIQVGSVTVKNAVCTYSMVTQQSSVMLSASSNGTQNNVQLSAGAIYEYDFSVYGPIGTYTMQIAFSYKKGIAQTAGNWAVQKSVTIQQTGGTNVRSATVKSFSQIAAESQEAQAKGVESARFGYALATAGAGVAVVAAVAIVAALVTIRKNRQTTTVA